MMPQAAPGAPAGCAADGSQLTRGAGSRGPAVRLHRERGRAEHDDETRHAQQRFAADRAVDQQRQPGEDRRTAATISRRRAWNAGSLARTAEANFGSSASDRSICSNSRCSCSESGTALLPGHDGRHLPEVDRPCAAGRLLRVSLRGRHGGSESGTTMAEPDFTPRRIGVDQKTGRTDGPTPEPGGHGVGGRLRLPPAVLRLAEGELAGRPRRRPAPPPGRRPAGSARRPARGSNSAQASRRSPVPRRSGAGSVRDRVMVRKSANRTLIDDRAPGDAGRAGPGGDLLGQRRAACGAATVGSLTSTSKVISAPIDFSTCSGLTRRGSRPQASSCRCAARASPTAAAQHADRRLGHVADRGQARAGAASRRCAPPRPTAPTTGSGCRNSSTWSAGTTSRPSGLARVEPSLATNLVGATPTEQVSPCSSATRRADQPAISAGRPNSRGAPATSRNASSSESGSTSGVTSRKIAMTAREAAA